VRAVPAKWAFGARLESTRVVVPARTSCSIFCFGFCQSERDYRAAEWRASIFHFAVPTIRRLGRHIEYRSIGSPIHAPLFKIRGPDRAAGFFFARTDRGHQPWHRMRIHDLPCCLTNSIFDWLSGIRTLLL
jgi:hypothetical protein